MNAARTIALLVLSLASSVPQVASVARAQTPEKLVVQSAHPGLIHRATAQGYQIQIDLAHSLAGPGRWVVDIQSYETGQWSSVTWEVGSLVAEVATVHSLETTEVSPALSGAAHVPRSDVLVKLDGRSYEANTADGQWTLDAKQIKPELKPGVYDVELQVTAKNGQVFADNTTGELVIRGKGAKIETPPAEMRVLMQHAFTIKHPIDPDSAEDRYLSMLEEIEKEAEKELRDGKKRTSGAPPTKESLVASGIKDRLTKYERSPNPPLRKLRTLRFSAAAKGKELEALKNLSRWIETDLLLTAIGVTPLERLSTGDIMKMHEEIYDILLARKSRDPKDYEYLTSDQVLELEKAITVRLVGDFTPHLATGETDRGFLSAPLVALDGKDVKSLLWQGRLEGAAAGQRVDWLRWQSPAKQPPVEVKAEAAQSCAWCVVNSEDGSQALRVISAAPEEKASFSLRVELPGAAGDEVRYETRPKRIVAFPF